MTEGSYADSFVQIQDTIENWDGDFEMMPQIVVTEVPLKNGYWYYYSPDGVLLEKKLYNYNTERKGTTYSNIDNR